jgi:RHH-type proline utilization regulon transcriptional repressor/proline dehydrogenase/delta 1-pyrroline-5-carboxylate dehydrogenase
VLGGEVLLETGEGSDFAAPSAPCDLEALLAAAGAIGASLRSVGGAESVFAAPSISVKLSALHPRYEVGKRARVMAELTPMVLELAQLLADQATDSHLAEAAE